MFLWTLVLRSTAQLFDEAPTFRNSLLQVCGSISPKVEPQLTIATPLDDDDGAQQVLSRSALRVLCVVSNYYESIYIVPD